MAVTVQDTYPPGTRGNACFLCNASQRQERGRTEPVLNLHQTIDFEGHVFIDETCAIEIGHSIGMVTADELQDLIAERDAALSAADAYAEDARIAIEAYESVLTAKDRFDDTPLVDEVAVDITPEPAPEPKPKSSKKGSSSK